MFFAPDLLSKIVFLLLSVIIIIIRIAGRVKDGDTILTIPTFATEILFAVFYILGVFLENSLMTRVNYYLAFAYVIFVLIYMNFSSLEAYLAVNREVENIPTKNIGRTNNLMLLGYLGLTVTVMLVVPFFGLDKAVRAAGRGILAFIRWLSSLRGEEAPIETVIEEVPPQESMTPEGGMFADTVETPLWLEALYHALTVAIGFVVAAIIIIGIVLAIYRLVKAFYRPTKENSDEEEFISDSDDKEYVPGAGGVFGRILERFDPSPNAVIRRTYRKTIRKTKTEVDASDTPREIEDAAKLPEGKERTVLHELYEKARYSKDGCTQEDVQTLRNA